MAEAPLVIDPAVTKSNATDLSFGPIIGVFLSLRADAQKCQPKPSDLEGKFTCTVRQARGLAFIQICGPIPSGFPPRLIAGIKGHAAILENHVWDAIHRHLRSDCVLQRLSL
jgi:hypothetical protein